MNFEWLSSLQIQKNCALIKWPPAIVVVSRKNPDRRRFVSKFDLTYLFLMYICWSHNPTIITTMNHPPLPHPLLVSCEGLFSCLCSFTIRTAALLAQSADRVTAVREVVGSIPGAGPIFRIFK